MLAEHVLWEVRATFVQFLCADLLLAWACACRSGDATTATADWRQICVGRYGLGCAQYLHYLHREARRIHQSWRGLYTGLRQLHRRLSAGTFCIDWSSGGEISIDSLGVSADYLENGHAALFSSSVTQGNFSILPFVPPGSTPFLIELNDFKNVEMISPEEIVCVAHDVSLERWSLCKDVGKKLMLRRPAESLAGYDLSTGVDLFVDHLANQIYVVVGLHVLAFSIDCLEHLYTITHPEAIADGCENVKVRWAHGLSFITYQDAGCAVAVWSTSFGQYHGRISARPLICSDVTYASWDTKYPDWMLVVTLEADGLIRLFDNKGTDGQWSNCYVLDDTMYVDVQVQGSHMLSVSHPRNGRMGAVHFWSLASLFSSPCWLLEQRGFREFAQIPSVAQLRHGGHLIELCFPSKASETLPIGVHDVMWLDTKDFTLPALMQLDSAVAECRCDVRDCIAVVERSSRRIRWARTFPALEAQHSRLAMFRTH